MIEQGFILAAGLGNRMRPLTDDRPKPMVMAAGKPIIAYALDAFIKHGIKTCVINTHYKADVLHDYLKARDDINIIISHEPDLMDTGGGITQGIQFLDKSKPVLIASGDSIWQDPQDTTSLQQLESAWNPNDMDLLLLLQPTSTMHDGVGDYDLIGTNAIRNKNKSGTHMWTSLRILNPAIMPAIPHKFSFLETMDNAEKSGRLHGITHTGIWHHLSTPDDVTGLKL